MSENTNDARSSARVRLERSVRLRYRLFQEFIEEVSSNISVGGMFIATEDPQEAGSRFDFEMVLEDGFPLIKGKGEVVWIRRRADGPVRPAGMGVRFLELEGSSRKLIRTIVDKSHESGAAPFDLERDRPREPTTSTDGSIVVEGESRVGGEALPIPDLTELLAEVDAESVSDSVRGEDRRVEDAPDGFAAGTDPEDPTPPARRFQAYHVAEPDPEPMSVLTRVTLLSIAAVVAGLGLVWLVDLLYVGPQIENVELAGTGTALSRQPDELPDGSTSGAEASRLADGEEIVEAPQRPLEPLETLDEWARAWSERRVDDYLSFYAAGFEPAAGGSREAWEDLRRERIGRHTNISVQVLLAEEARVGSDEAVVSFVQTYSADGYEDRVRKRVRLVREKGAWRIHEEQVVRALPD